jgi:hypothetical protein
MRRRPAVANRPELFVNRELCRASRLCPRHERGLHEASKSSLGPVIPRAAKRVSCSSKSTSPLSNSLDNSILPKVCIWEQILAKGVQLGTYSCQWRATGNIFLPKAFSLVTVSSPLGLSCSSVARLRHRSCTMTPLPQKFRDLAKEFPNSWEVRRIAQLTPSCQDRHWRFVRASRSIFDLIPAAIYMDVLFYRFPSERGYCQRLSQLKPYVKRTETVDLTVDLICLPTPWVSGQWKDTLPLDLRQRIIFHARVTYQIQGVPKSLSTVPWPSEMARCAGAPVIQVDCSRKSARSTAMRSGTASLCHGSRSKSITCPPPSGTQCTSKLRNVGTMNGGLRPTCSYHSRHF